MKHRHSPEGEESGPTRVQHATRSDTLPTRVYYFFLNVDTLFDTRIGVFLKIKIKNGVKFEITKNIKIKNKNKTIKAYNLGSNSSSLSLLWLLSLYSPFVFYHFMEQFSDHVLSIWIINAI